MWDLRKNDPIIQINDSSSRIRCKAVAWHPDVATQMVTASEDDRAPVIQVSGLGPRYHVWSGGQGTMCGLGPRHHVWSGAKIPFVVWGQGTMCGLGPV